LTKWGTSCPVCKHDIRTETMSSEVILLDWNV
jgi:E3 ubiquitin-protein ligase RNF13